MEGRTGNLFIVAIACVLVQCSLSAELSRNKFSCEGRASGYYADVDSGCQVYHMCDGLGRQFSYSCPNTTLFQQRMLICDHWYMVNCSKSELDYSANLLIGQKDKPFVDDSQDNPYHRTPRPDLETHPYAPRFQNDYREARAFFGSSRKNLVGVDTEETEDSKTTDGPTYFLPSHWSTQYSKKYTTPLPPLNKKQYKISVSENENLNKQLLIDALKATKPIKNVFVSKNIDKKETVVPSRFSLLPVASASSSTPRIELPLEDQKVPSRFTLPPFISSQNRPTAKSITTVDETTQSTIFVVPIPATSELPPKLPEIVTTTQEPTTVSIPKTSLADFIKTTTKENVPRPNSESTVNEIEPPSIYYQPPKLTYYYQTDSTTMDPLTFAELSEKLVPSKNLLPPKLNDRSDDGTQLVDSTTLKSVTKKDISTTSSGSTTDQANSDKRWKELRQLFFIPEYDFPLDPDTRPSYDSNVSSFQVKQPLLNTQLRPNPESQGQKCDPKCDPTFLRPGTCKPCVTIRR